MDYRLSDQKFISLDSDGLSHVEAVIWVASSEDVLAYDGISGYVLEPGSATVIPSESRLLLLDLDNTWKEWGA